MPPLEATKRATAGGMYGERGPAAWAGYQRRITIDRRSAGACGSRRARSLRAIERIPTGNAPVAAGTRKEVAAGGAALAVLTAALAPARTPPGAAGPRARSRPA